MVGTNTFVRARTLRGCIYTSCTMVRRLGPRTRAAIWESPPDGSSVSPRKIRSKLTIGDRPDETLYLAKWLVVTSSCRRAETIHHLKYCGYYIPCIRIVIIYEVAIFCGVDFTCRTLLFHTQQISNTVHPTRAQYHGTAHGTTCSC